MLEIYDCCQACSKPVNDVFIEKGLIFTSAVVEFPNQVETSFPKQLQSKSFALNIIKNQGCHSRMVKGTGSKV